MTEYPVWSRDNPLDISRYVNQKVKQWLRLTENAYDLSKQVDGRIKLIQAIYAALQLKSIRYDIEEFHPSNALQRIRTPQEMLGSPGQGTCLDLATLFCGICLGYRLLPIIIVLEDHALAAVSLKRDLSQWNAYGRPRKVAEYYVTDKINLEQLLLNNDCIVVECTGFASSQHMRQLGANSAPETVGRDEKGLLSFEQAVKAGTEQLGLNARPLQFAIDIAAAQLGGRIDPYILDLPTRFEPENILSPLKTIIPHPLTRLVGRKKQCAKVVRKLKDHRLVTLTGPGGVGKTRLAIEVAQKIGHDFIDGVCFIELASLNVPSLLSKTVAAEVGLQTDTLTDIDSKLAEFLAPRVALLILDNCEHLRTECAGLAMRLISQCSGLKVLATSREHLHITGEMVIPVPPLELPFLENDPLTPIAKSPSLSALSKVESVSLFVERARDVTGGAFRFDFQNANDIAFICSRLDGIPLAIELAAARVGGMSISEIAKRLSNQFAFLEGDDSTVTPRHLTLKATLDWSYELLSKEEQKLLQLLSLFRGGWTLEAAEFICANSNGNGIGSSVILQLTNLVNKSLIRFDGSSGQGRFIILETIREYGEQCLIDADRMDGEWLHAHYFQSLAEPSEVALRSHEQKEWLTRLDVEHDNFRVALVWALNNAPQNALALCGALGWFWHMHGHMTEGLNWIRKALSAAKEEESAISLERAKALLSGAYLATASFNAQQGLLYAEESAYIFRKLQDEHGEACGIAYVGFCYAMLANFDAARSSLAKAEAVFRLRNDKWWLASALNARCLEGSYTGCLSDFQEQLTESLGLYRSVGDRWGIGVVLNYKGQVENQRQNFEQAVRDHYEARNALRELNEYWIASATSCNLGFELLHLNRFSDASSAFRDCVSLALYTVNPHEMGSALIGMAHLHARDDRFKEAAFLIGAATFSIEALGGFLPGLIRNDIRNFSDTVERKIGSRDFKAAFDNGKNATVDEAVSQAFDYYIDGHSIFQGNWEFLKKQATEQY